MPDDRDARIAQLEAQVRQFQNLHAAARAEIAALRAQVTEHDDSPEVEAVTRALVDKNGNTVVVTCPADIGGCVQTRPRSDKHYST